MWDLSSYILQHSLFSLNLILNGYWIWRRENLELTGCLENPPIIISYLLRTYKSSNKRENFRFSWVSIFRAGFFWTPPMYNGSVVVWCREDGRSRGHWDRLRQREDSIVIPTTCSDYCILPELRGKLEIKLNQPENVNFSNIYWTHFLTLIHFRTWNSRKLKVVEN